MPPATLSAGAVRPWAGARLRDGRAWAAVHRLECLFVGGGLLIRLLFWLITDRRFEDGLITVTHARNAAHGLGLTHHPFEEATHGFTSAISVLVPLLGELISFEARVNGFLTLRLASLVAFAATIVAAARLADGLGLTLWPRVFMYGVLTLSFNQILFGMSGMETQIAVAILLWAVVAGVERRPVAAGVLYGLCLLARPDFVLFVGPALLWWFVHDRRSAVRVALIAGLVVLPWLVFTTAYYGSPVPNTIEAKSLRYPIPWPDLDKPGTWWDFVAGQVRAREPWFSRVLSPYYENPFVTGAPLLATFSGWFAGGLFALAVGGMVAVRRLAGWLPVVAFLVLFTVYRLLALPTIYYEWYYPPFVALVVVCGAVALERLRVIARRGVAVIAIVVAGAFAFALTPQFVLEERYQHEIEDRARIPLAHWLRTVPRGSVVTSESAGYVGYYSGANIKLWDYPGLTSKEAFAIMEVLGSDRSSLEWLAHAALPDYAIWRPAELALFQEKFPDSAALYEEAERFFVLVDDKRMSSGGVHYTTIDREFVVMKRVRGERGGIERARRLVGG